MHRRVRERVRASHADGRKPADHTLPRPSHTRGSDPSPGTNRLDTGTTHAVTVNCPADTDPDNPSNAPSSTAKYIGNPVNTSDPNGGAVTNPGTGGSRRLKASPIIPRTFSSLVNGEPGTYHRHCSPSPQSRMK